MSEDLIGRLLTRETNKITLRLAVFFSLSLLIAMGALGFLR